MAAQTQSRFISHDSSVLAVARLLFVNYAEGYVPIFAKESTKKLMKCVFWSVRSFPAYETHCRSDTEILEI
jgi:hypothetical protein